MSKALIEIEQEASQLSSEERAKLAFFLIQSLEPSEQGDLDEVWRIEAEARLTEIERGEANLVPGQAVFSDIRRRLG